MTHSSRDGSQVLQVGMLARVEGEGGMHIEIDKGTVTSVKLNIFEPPRFYEAFLRGREYTEPPDITARICGICPVAYQTASCEAIEMVCGAEIPEQSASCVGSSTAGSGSRATPCTSTSSTRRTSSATTGPSRWPPTTRTSSNAACA